MDNTPTAERREIHAGLPDAFTSFVVAHAGISGDLTLGYRERATGETTCCLTREHRKTGSLDEAERWIIEQAAPVLASIAAFVKAKASEPAPCPRCHSAEKVTVDDYGVGVSVYCLDCYDGAPDAGRQLVGGGRTSEAALADWNSVVRDYEDDQAYEAEQRERGKAGV